MSGEFIFLIIFNVILLSVILFLVMKKTGGWGDKFQNKKNAQKDSLKDKYQDNQVKELIKRGQPNSWNRPDDSGQAKPNYYGNIEIKPNRVDDEHIPHIHDQQNDLEEERRRQERELEEQRRREEEQRLLREQEERVKREEEERLRREEEERRRQERELEEQRRREEEQHLLREQEERVKREEEERLLREAEERMKKEEEERLRKEDEERRLQEKELEEQKTAKSKETVEEKPKPTFLVVDDTRFMRNIIRKILEDEGYEVVGEAESGKEAIRMAEKLAPTVITMDITMPDMDGITAAEEIIKKQPQMKIIMCSAADQREKIIEAVRVGAKDFIGKPFEKDKALEAIKRVISS